MNKHIHFIGICGVAMSALAIAFKKAGYEITGSDVGFYPPVSTNLKTAGITFYPGWHPEKMVAGGKPDMVIVGNVASSSNPEWQYVQKHRIPYHSYPEVVRDSLIKKNSIVCAGTFGKSTSATLLTWILVNAGFDPSYMFGSVAQNNLPPANLTNSNWSVVEGDEYKASRSDNGPKFLYYKPTHVLLTSVVWDHADVYPTENVYRQAFQKLIDSVPHTGLLVISEKAVPIVDCKGRSVVTYGKTNKNTYSYHDVHESINGIRFTITSGDRSWDIASSCLGEYMADNITGCFALAREIGVPEEKIIAAATNFKGVRRRLEKRYEDGPVVFDDIAHSPQKAQAVLATLRTAYRGQITAVFEPNTGNREVASIDGYTNAFRAADTVYVPELTKLKIADGKPLPLDGETLAGVIRESHPDVRFEPSDVKLVEELKKNTRPEDVVVFLGSHGFRGMIDELLTSLRLQRRP